MRARFYLTQNAWMRFQTREIGCYSQEIELAGELAKELAFVHTVLEGFSAIDEDDRNFIVELATNLVIGINVDFTPGETAVTGELRQAFLHDFAEMASLAGVNHDLAGVWHGRDFSVSAVQFPA